MKPAGNIITALSKLGIDRAARDRNKTWQICQIHNPAESMTCRGANLHHATPEHFCQALLAPSASHTLCPATGGVFSIREILGAET